MTEPIHLLVPGPLDQRTGGFIYDRRVVEGLREAGHEVVVHQLAGSFPDADALARRAAADSLERIKTGARLVIDGLALPAFADLLDRLPADWVALVHHPLAMETGLSADEARAFAALERKALALAARVIVTSPQTCSDLAAYGVPVQRIGVVLPGTDPAPLVEGSADGPLELLCVASLTPRKGFPVLLEALARLPDLDWQLTCVGSLERDPECARQVLATARRLGLERRVTFVGERAERELEPYYRQAAVFVLASHHEGYGMALAEALARGLPVVSTTAGAIPGTVPAAAGLLVPPGDPEALADALRRVVSEPGLRERLAAGARTARLELPDWPTAAARFAAEVERVG